VLRVDAAEERPASLLDLARSAVLSRVSFAPPRSWAQRIATEIRVFQPDVALVAAPTGLSLGVLVRRAVPVVHVVEATPPPVTGEAVSSSRVEPVLARMCRPRVVATTAELEQPPMGRRWPRSTRVVIPVGIDVDHWGARVTPDRRSACPVFTSGAHQQGELRPLLDVADEIERRRLRRSLTIGVASAAPLMTPAPGAIHPLGDVRDLRQGYAGAQVALVTTPVLTKARTQILQAWAAGCPVVTTTAAARSVRARDGHELAAAHDATGIVDRLVLLLSDPGRAARLAVEGRRVVHACHSLDAVADGLEIMLRAATR
jgi:hypothetical protein